MCLLKKKKKLLPFCTLYFVQELVKKRRKLMSDIPKDKAMVVKTDKILLIIVHVHALYIPLTLPSKRRLALNINRQVGNLKLDCLH